MSDDRGQDLMGYAAMEQEASRGVVKAALRRAAQPDGLPGGHHLYITFRTHGAGVTVPPELSARYPDEMTIVLQHQFWDLAPGETFFAVTLKFGGSPKRLSVPYAAVTRFYDPSVQYLLQFDAAAAPVQSPEPEVVPLRPRGTGDSAPVALPTPLREARPVAEDAPAAEAGDQGAPEKGAEKEAEREAEKEDGPKIVSLDQFRKK